MEEQGTIFKELKFSTDDLEIKEKVDYHKEAELNYRLTLSTSSVPSTLPETKQIFDNFTE